MPDRSLARSIVAVCLPIITSACGSLAPNETALPPGAVLMATPAVYLEWHAKTEQCSGRTGSFSTLEFYVVPGVETFPTSDGRKVGEWVTEGASSRIVIAGKYQDHEMVVRHEMLHSLLRAEGHPSEYFVNRCRLTWESWNGPRESVALGSPE